MTKYERRWSDVTRAALIDAVRTLERHYIVATAVELPASVAELRQRTSRDVWIVGGGQTARVCLSAGLVDELELYVIPILLGAGVPLLLHHESAIPLRLLDQHVFPGGVTRLRYAVERRNPSPR